MIWVPEASWWTWSIGTAARDSSKRQEHEGPTWSTDWRSWWPRALRRLNAGPAWWRPAPSCGRPPETARAYESTSTVRGGSGPQEEGQRDHHAVSAWRIRARADRRHRRPGIRRARAPRAGGRERHRAGLLARAGADLRRRAQRGPARACGRGALRPRPPRPRQLPRRPRRRQARLA